jgi:hypothetical protein
MTAVAALLVALLPATRLSAEQPPRNVRGIHTLAATRDAINDQLSWASAMVGAGGHVTQPFLGIDAATLGPTADAIAYVEGAYARQLDPILVLQGRYVNRDGCNATGYVGWLAPIPDESGGRYQREAAGYARFVAGLPRVDGRTLLIQIANEPNLHEMWGGASDAAAYARFTVDVAAEIRALGDPRIQVLNAALAPEGNIDNLQFIAEAVQAEPAFGRSFDLWASHPYPHNQPPANNFHDGTALPGSRYTIDAYLLELAVLAQHGVDTAQIQVVLTETGYELGDTHFAQFPPVTDDLRAEYMVQAFRDHWSRWPEVRAVTPFQLSGWYGSWRAFDWVHPSSRTTPSGLPTQPRIQYGRMVPGLGMVTGTVVDDRGVPVDAAEVVAEPGGFQATSLPDGTFVLLARPGNYTLRVVKDGFGSVQPPDLSVAAGERTSLALTLPAQLSTALLNPSFERSLYAWTRWGDVDGAHGAPWFSVVAAPAESQFLGTAVNCGAKDGGVHQSVSTVAGTTVSVRAWTLTYRDGVTPIGNRIGIDPWGGTDPRSANIIWTVPVETGGQWQLVSLAARAESDRATVFLEHDQDAANPWNVSAFDGVELVQSP